MSETLTIEKKILTSEKFLHWFPTPYDIIFIVHIYYWDDYSHLVYYNKI